MKKIGSILLAALCWAGAARAQIHESKIETRRAGQYERVDFTVTLTAEWTNPYLQEEVALDLLLTSPSGREMTLPCYYVEGPSGGRSTWAARFTPQEAGDYVCRFRLTGRGVEASLAEAGRLKVRPTRKAGMLHVKDNWTLVYDDGTPFRGVAENLCWESRANDDSKFFKALHERHDKYNYEYLLPLFARNGGNFCRVWMCSWNFPIDRQRDFNNTRYEASDEYFNPSAVKKLDRLMELSEELGVHIMLCMGQGDVAADRSFFVSDGAKARYRNRLRYIVARWGYSPAVGMWEFFNEIDNIQFRNAKHPIPAAEIVAWHAEMSRYLKSIDPYGHIVTTSISHRDLEGLNSVPDIDVNQKHIYCNTSGMPAEIVRYENRFGKPYVIGEFGYEWDWSKNFDEFAEDMDADFKRGLWYGLFSPTPVTPMSWWWEYFENRGLMPYFRGVRRISDRMLADGGGSFEQLSVKTGAAECYAVKCGETVYAYVYNAAGRAIDEPMVVNLGVNGGYEAVRFDPETLGETKLGTIATDGRFVLEHVGLQPRGEALYIFTPVRK